MPRYIMNTLSYTTLVLAAALVTLQPTSIVAFTTRTTRPTFTRLSSSSSADQEQVITPTPTDHDSPSSLRPPSSAAAVVRAPLKYIGPYPCLALRFPQLATANQIKRNETGVGLDFVLDTAANTNTINVQVAKELQLKVVGNALPGLGAGGAISGGDTYLLGDCQLDGLPKNEQFTFMTGLTAAALPVASPASAGLLSMSFLNCFEGGVEFQWNPEMMDGMIASPPSVTFHGDESTVKNATVDMTRVPIKPLPVTLLPSVTIEINGVAMPALLDSGSPITVMNAQAAEVAGVEMMHYEGETTQQSNNPLAAMADKFKAAQQSAQAAARGDVLAIMDAQGKRVELRKSADKVHVALAGDDKVDFGKGQIYVGDLPGLAAMNAIGVDSPPAVVLGMDVLRTRPKMFLRSKSNEVYF